MDAYRKAAVQIGINYLMQEGSIHDRIIAGRAALAMGYGDFQEPKGAMRVRINYRDGEALETYFPLYFKIGHIERMMEHAPSIECVEIMGVIN